MERSRLSRLPTGVEGLDKVMCGGLQHPSSYLLAGGPGTGKTVLSSQIAFALAKRHAKTMFVSVLTEPYSHLIRNLANLSFFDDHAINRELTFVSAYSILEAQGLQGMEEMLRLSLPQCGAQLVVLDNIGMLSGYASSLLEYRAFLQKIIALSSMAGASLMASTDRPFSSAATEYGSFDWVIELKKRQFGLRTLRTLEVRKSRGSFALEGEHAFDIREAGLNIYPRLESGWLGAPQDRVWRERLSWGIDGLGELAGGGVERGTVTGVVGPTGSGKTSLCIAFAAAALRAGEKVLYLTHHESPSRILEAARGLGIDLESGVRDGQLNLLWMPPEEASFERDVVAFFKWVEGREPFRLIMDGLDAVRRVAVYPERFSLMWRIATDHLRGRGITLLFATEELPQHGLHESHEIPWSNVENIFCLQDEVTNGQRIRFLRAVKTRGRQHDSAGRILDISDRGVRLVPLPHSGPKR